MVYTEFKLFVGGLSWETTAETLKAAFQDYGEIPFHRICSDQDTGNSRGFGFVSFMTEAEGMKACEEMDGFMLEGRSLSVRPAGEKPKPGGDGYGGGGGGYGGDPQTRFKSQECYAWAKGQCSRGDACRFSHEGPGSAGVKPKQACFAWAKGDCKYGEGCNYAHEPGLEGTVDPNTSQRQAKKIFGQEPAAPPAVKVDLGAPAAAAEAEASGTSEKKRKAEDDSDDDDDGKKKAKKETKKSKKEKKEKKKDKKSKKEKKVKTEDEDEKEEASNSNDAFAAKAEKILKKKLGRDPTSEEVAKKAKKLAKKAAAAE